MGTCVLLLVFMFFQLSVHAGDWSPCVTQREHVALGVLHCATHPVPLDWQIPKGKMSELHVRRSTARGRGLQAAQGHMWFLGSGEEELMLDVAVVVSHLPYDFFFPRFRGGTLSRFLGCPAQQSPISDEGQRISNDEWPACVAHLQSVWGQDLLLFSATNAAHDVAHAMEMELDNGAIEGSAILYGAGYGSLWATRVSQLRGRESLIGHVILDGILTPDFLLTPPPHPKHGTMFLKNSRVICASCANDDGCGRTLGTDPHTAVLNSYAEMEESSCVGAGRLAKPGFFNLAADALPAFASLCETLVAIATMLQRCNKSDMDVLSALGERISDFHDKSLSASSFLPSFWPILFYLGIREARLDPYLHLDTSHVILSAATPSRLLILDGVNLAGDPRLGTRPPSPPAPVVRVSVVGAARTRKSKKKKGKTLVEGDQPGGGGTQQQRERENRQGEARRYERFLRSGGAKAMLLLSVPRLGAGCVRGFLRNQSDLCLPEAVLDWHPARQPPPPPRPLDSPRDDRVDSVRLAPLLLLEAVFLGVAWLAAGWLVRVSRARLLNWRGLRMPWRRA